MNLAGSVVAAVSGLALVVLVARWLEPDRAGTFFTLIALFLLVESVAVLGTDTGLARFLLRLEGVGEYAAVVALCAAARRVTVCTAGLAALVLVVGAWLVGALAGWSADLVWSVSLVATALPSAVLCDVSLASTRAFGDMRSSVLLDRVLRSASQPIGVALALAGGGGLSGALLAWTVSHHLAAAGSVVALNHRLRARGLPPLPGLTRHPIAPGGARDGVRVLAEFWAYNRLRVVARVAQISIQKVDVILVAVLASPQAAAAYTVATRFVPLGQLVTQPIQWVLQPRVAEILTLESRDTLREVHRVATAWLVLLAWPLYLGVAALASTYLGLFGADLAQADHARAVVVVMALTMLVAVATGPVDTLLLMAGRIGLSAANAVAALVIDVAGCVVLVPRLGILGAAVAWSLAVLTRCGLAVLQVERDLEVHALAPVTLRAALLPVLVVGLPASALAVSGVPGVVVWPGVGALVAGYLAVLWCTRAVWGLQGVWARPPVPERYEVSR